MAQRVKASLLCYVLTKLGLEVTSAVVDRGCRDDVALRMHTLPWARFSSLRSHVPCPIWGLCRLCLVKVRVRVSVKVRVRIRVRVRLRLRLSRLSYG